MNKIRYSVLFALFVGFFAMQNSYAQQKNRDDFMMHVHEICNNPDIIEIDKSPDGYIEVEFICDGKRYEMGIKNNKLLFCEYRIERDEVPFDKIAEKLEKDYSGWVLDEISRVVMPDTTFLKVELINKGIEHNLYFTNDGKWYKIKPLNLASDFNLELFEKSTVYAQSAYDFLRPDAVHELPEVLKEVSGIATATNGNIYCIQDELGAVFEFNPTDGNLVKLYRFTDVGDFEGLASEKDVVYVLRSDGNLFIYDTAKQKLLNETMLQTNSLNLEGICLRGEYLYAVSKEPGIGQSAAKRSVFRAAKENPAATELFFEVDLDELNRFAETHYPDLELRPVQFNPSAIEIHPVTDEVYILSADGRWVAIYKERVLISLIPLPASLYHKPEGFTFLDNGDLLISSEGEKKGFLMGTISLLKYKQRR